MKLNIGCGDLKRPGYVNVDVCGSPDRVCDLSVFPWPWESNTVEEVRADHFLEHVNDYECTILEIHRVLQPGGVLWIRVPHFRCPMSVWHLHKWAFSTCTLNFLCDSIPYQWGGRPLFERVETRINYAFIPDRTWANRRLKSMLTALANLSPYLWDWLGLPIEEIEFKGRKR